MPAAPTPRRPLPRPPPRPHGHCSTARPRPPGPQPAALARPRPRSARSRDPQAPRRRGAGASQRPVRAPKRPIGWAPTRICMPRPSPRSRAASCRLIGRGPRPPAPAAPSSAAGAARGRPGSSGRESRRCLRRGSSALPFSACGRLRSEARGRGARRPAERGGAEPPHEEGPRALGGEETLCVLRELGGGATGTATRAAHKGPSGAHAVTRSTGREGRPGGGCCSGSGWAIGHACGEQLQRAAGARCLRARGCHYFLLIFCPVELSLSQPARVPHPTPPPILPPFPEG